MKYIPELIYLLTITLSLSCTGHRKTDNILTRAEEIIDSNPDSTLMLLKSIGDEADNLSQNKRMRYMLLQTQAMNKTDIPLDTMTGVKEMAEYFNRHGNANEKMKAYYMLGSVYRDRGNAPAALTQYRIAVSVADTTAADCDFKTLSRIYGQIATLFDNLLTPELSHKAELKAVEYAEKANDTIAAIIFYEHLGSTFRMQKKYDSVLYIANNVYKKYKAIGQEQLAAGTLPQAIDIYLIKGQYGKAKQAMNEFEQKSGLFNKKGEVIKGKEIYYDSKALYYEVSGKLDSAEYFYRKLLNYKSDITNLECGYKGLMSVYQKIGIADSAVKYAELFAEINDSSSFLRSSENIIKMQALYDYTENQKIAEGKTREVEHYKYMTALLFIIFLAGIYILYISIKRYKRNKNRETAAANRKYFDALSRLNKAETETKLLKEDFDTYKDIKQNEVEELRQTMTVICKENNMPESCTVGQALLNCAIIQQMHIYAGKLKTPSAEEWQELYRITEENMPCFYERINDSQTNLTRYEKNVSLLTRFQFTPNEISVLMNVSKQRITNIRSSINKKLFNCEGTKSLNHNIKSI